MGIVVYTIAAFFIGCFVATVLLFFVMGSYHFDNDEEPNKNKNQYDAEHRKQTRKGNSAKE